jgi:hypothetical protein
VYDLDTGKRMKPSIVIIGSVWVRDKEVKSLDELEKALKGLTTNGQSPEKKENSMGTRNLTVVFVDGEYKVAQYGQWDGYPEGQGVTALEFLRGEGNLDKLKESLKRVRYVDGEGRDKELVDAYEKNAPAWSNEHDNRTPEQKRWFEMYMSRNIGADILHNIANSEDEEILLANQIDFAKDGLFCEWVWKIDLDNNLFGSCYSDLNFSLSFNLNELPSEENFLAAFKDDDMSERAWEPCK